MMPRTARSTEAGMVYHVLNRGNGRMRIFHKAGDFEAFERVLAEGLQRYPVDLLTYCLMPNHWHLVVRPKTDEALGHWMGWVGVAHLRRYHEHHHSRGGGHLYQGRFKRFRWRRTITSWHCAATSRRMRCERDWWSVPNSGNGVDSGDGRTGRPSCR